VINNRGRRWTNRTHRLSFFSSDAGADKLAEVSILPHRARVAKHTRLELGREPHGAQSSGIV